MTLVILISGYLVYHFEDGKSPYFHTWWDGIWFAIITSATVGYGDKYPVTVPGQLVTIALILIGGSLLAVLLANIGGRFALQISRKERGLLPAHLYRNHVVICHWNKQAKAAIRDYYRAHRKMRFVLIDNYIEENPIPEYDVHFIRGNFSEDEVLIKANVRHAKAVLIFGDKRIDESTADAKALKAVLAIKYLNPDVYTIVECLSGDVRALERVGADEVIDTGEINGRLLVQSSLSVGVSNVLKELLIHESGNEFYETMVPDKYLGQSFGEAAVDMRRLGKNLIALGGKETILNPAPDMRIEQEHTLIYIGRGELSF
jgi:voltage-gated potassium channel